MSTLLVATTAGCRVFTDAGEAPIELAGRYIGPIAAEDHQTCIAIVDSNEIWRRDATGSWSKIATAPISLQSLTARDGTIYAGGMDEPAVLRISADGQVERLTGFDHTPGREEWIANGPPLGVRSLTATQNSSAILAAVHVGGIPRSIDSGATWNPTLPILYDFHEVQVHPSHPNFVAAAAAVGLCISHDGGQNWKLHTEGLPLTDSLAVAVLEDEILFSIQDGPFAKQSQLWRWLIATEQFEQVRDGLPEYLEGKIDTCWIAAGRKRAAVTRSAVIDKAGNLWLSERGSTGWHQVATIAPYFSGLYLVD